MHANTILHFYENLCPQSNFPKVLLVLCVLLLFLLFLLDLLYPHLSFSLSFFLFPLILFFSSFSSSWPKNICQKVFLAGSLQTTLKKLFLFVLFFQKKGKEKSSSMWIRLKTVGCRTALVCAQVNAPGERGCLTPEAMSPADVWGAKKLDSESQWSRLATT